MSNSKGYWVTGGSWVFVPEARLHEIPKILEEYREQLAQKTKVLVPLRQT